MCVFFRDCGVRTVLESSCILYTLRFCARFFLAFIAMDGMYAGFAGAKGCHNKKSELLGAPFDKKFAGLLALVPVGIHVESRFAFFRNTVFNS